MTAGARQRQTALGVGQLLEAAGVQRSGSEPASDYRELMIAQLVADEGDLLDLVVDLVCERDAYRELARAALQTISELTTARQRDRQRLIDTLEETRLFRLAVRGERSRRAA